jgi:hypothetical protein
VPTPDRLRPAPFVAGLAGGATVALIGIWLVLAPFAVGYQPDGAGWVDATLIGVVTGGVLIVLGLGTLLVLALGLRDEARRHGIDPVTSAEPIEVDPAPEDPTGEGPAAEDPAEGAELQTVLAPLAAALLEDLRNGQDERTGPHPPATSPPDQRPR